MINLFGRMNVLNQYSLFTLMDHKQELLIGKSAYYVEWDALIWLT